MPTSTRNTEPTISVAFRFHVNFYHSYRGDSLDERGIGPDIRIITSILDTLDELNGGGIPVRGTWDIENYYSLELYIPEHAPQLIERIAERVASGHDEVELMSYNNGIVSAHTAEEFDRAIGWAVSNPAGSGLIDLFGARAPIVRPQECMITPSQLARYREHGVEAVSIYYASLPFNGFSTFVPPLSFSARYNPLTLTAPGIDESITLLPAYNHGDIADHLPGLRHWVRAMRRRQLQMTRPRDLLLLIDMDADDPFWEGIRMPVVPKLLRSFNGLTDLVKQVAKLPYVRFVRPSDYLTTHEPVATVSYGQDTADGSFDGYSSWAEKWENTAVWSTIHRARYRAAAAANLAGSRSDSRGDLSDSGPLDESLTARLLAMSTTHFGLASPVMNVARLADAHRRGEAALEAADRALGAARERAAGGNAAEEERAALILDAAIDHLPIGRGSLVSIDTTATGSTPPATAAPEGIAILQASGGQMTITATFEAGEAAAMLGQSVRIVANPRASRLTARELQRETAFQADTAPRLTADAVVGAGITVRRLPGELLAVDANGEDPLREPLAGPWIRYAGRVCRSQSITCAPVAYTAGAAAGAAAAAGFRRTGEIVIPGGKTRSQAHRTRWADEILLVAGLPYVFVEVWIMYPGTSPHGYARAKAGRLGRSWDTRWEEVAPAELQPAIRATPDEPVTVWKRNFEGAVSHYQIDYHRFSRNRNVDSCNNHITAGWVAVAGSAGGLLVAQSAALDNSFAFCPLRTRIEGGHQLVSMNPFGTYTGNQLRYPTAITGLGRFMALRMAEQLDSYAPSFAGNSSHFALMLAPYGNAPEAASNAEGAGPPPERLQRDALLFATPAVVG